MILVDLKEFIEDNGYISGNAILKARAKADSMHKSKLAHFDLGGELVSYPSDAVVFSEEPDDYQINAIYSSWSNPRLSEEHVYGSLLANSSEYEHWDGRSIFDLISVLQKGAEQRNLENLSALIAYRPIALQSPRLTQSILQKYRCGEEASKAHHFYIDREGRALTTLPDVKRFFERNAGLELQHSDDYYWNDYNRVGYYLCSESDLPNLLSMCKNGDLHHNVLKVSGKDCYKIDTFGEYGKDGITVQKVTANFQKSDSKIEPSHIKSSIPLNEYGYTAKQVKHAMEWICNEYYTGTRTMSYISGMSLSQLSEFVDIAVRDELIESVNEPKHPMFPSLPVEPFRCTVKGNALSMKKGSKRMTENALNKHKATIVERYLDAQKHKDKMVFVPSVLGYFGSAIDKGATDYGDLDVFYVALPSPEANKAIEDFLEDRPRADPALVYRHILCSAYDEGTFPLKPPSVDDYSSLSRYADKVAKNFLKRRSKLISVHELGEVMSINADFEVHYIGDKRLDKPITGFDELKAVLLKEFDLGGQTAD